MSSEMMAVGAQKDDEPESRRRYTQTGTSIYEVAGNKGRR